MKPQRKRESAPTGVDEWSQLLPAYERLIADESRDSAYLRSVGVQRNLVDLLGDCSDARLLDVGSGNGWLLDAVPTREGFECDCMPQRTPRPGRPFSVEDVCSLSYASNSFDIVVASLVLMWVDDVERACRELSRVTARDGRVVVALVHPFSYRTGHITESGDFQMVKRYSEPFVLPNLFIAGAVGPLRYFHRPLATYVNALCGAGLRLEQMREWSLDMDDYKRHFPQGTRGPARTDRVPMYAFFSLRKVQQ
jgi:SAM-dependent methyltransferase